MGMGQIDMDKEFKNVEGILSRLDDLHKNHIKSFDHEGLPDLEKQTETREIEVGLLIKSIRKLVTLAKDQTGERANTESLLLKINNRVTILLEQNKLFLHVILVRQM